MKSNIWLSRLCIIFLMVLGCYVAGATNLLPNSSFETAGSGNLAESWYSSYDGYTRSNDTQKQGSWSCKLVGGSLGMGGAVVDISSGFMGHETFTASNNIYISSYSQGAIYGTYVTVYYTDETADYFGLSLSSAQIAANMNTWKNYSYTFTTDPTKTIAAISYWCLVWADGANKFIGTVYYDDLKLTVFKPALFWHGKDIYEAADPNQAAADVLARGFTHAHVIQYDEGNGAAFLGSKGFNVVKDFGPTKWGLANTPRSYSPYNDKTTYDNAKQAMADMLNAYPEISGISDDIEEGTFPSTTYSEDGTATVHTFSDLEYRIGNQTPQSSGWPVFKNYPTTGAHNVSNLTIDNIEFNFPVRTIGSAANTTTAPDTQDIVGWYGPGFTYQSYEMAAQTFKPTDQYITRIDMKIKRYGSSFPLGSLYYYLTEVDANGKPDLSKMKSRICSILPTETNIAASWNSWDGIVLLPLYFDPVAVGVLDTTKTYAVVIEFSKKNNDNWNSSYYYVGGFSTNVYADGQAWLRSDGVWRTGACADCWFIQYKPNQPQGYTRNQFHEDWIDFQCSVIAKYVAEYRTIADAASSPYRSIWIYSGYTQSMGTTTYGNSLHTFDGVTRRTYSVDWTKLAAVGINYAICGYGSVTITDTINALSAGASPRPKLIGGGYNPYGESSFDERYNTCDGVMLFYDPDDPGWVVPAP